jgi:hypothetical protein
MPDIGMSPDYRSRWDHEWETCAICRRQVAYRYTEQCAECGRTVCRECSSDRGTCGALCDDCAEAE